LFAGMARYQGLFDAFGPSALGQVAASTVIGGLVGFFAARKVQMSGGRGCESIAPNSRRAAVPSLALLPAAQGGCDITADSGGCTQPGSAAPKLATSVL
jgi:hypothetical protein